ncbi:MAG: glycoside hydrolase family 95 protein [Desulfobulbaceae bacterium]|nr:glycoside hydrolase family 95 protein [Desulfobulbaceae bacterium]
MKRFTCLLICCVFVSLAVGADSKVKDIRPFVVWDDKPASIWTHAYPVGNGRLGAMPFGGYPNEQILLNEETIWQGRNSMNNSYDAKFVVEEIRDLLFAGDFAKAHAKINGELLVPRITPRAFQPMGDLRLAYKVTQGNETYKNYKRYLSMNDALAVTEIETTDGNYIKQQVLSSHPDNVMIVHIESKKENALSLAVKLDRFDYYETEAINDNTLAMHGQAQKDGKQRGTYWHTAARVLTEGGSASKKENTIEVDSATAVTIIIAASTDYNHRRPFVSLRHDRLKACLDTLAKVEKTSFKVLKKRHIADHRQFFDRATVDLGDTPAETLKMPTPARLTAYNQGGHDPDLIEDFFQMGRYMLIASSRVGTLPPNLTGIWNANPDPACHSDWHLNINVQENFWHAELTNLSELHEPFITLIDDISKGQGKQLAEKLGCRGFLATHATHAWKESAFSGSSWWGMWPTGGAWSCGHVMEHYRFSQDKEYLAKVAYPILKANVEFCLDWLVENPETGKLVSGPSASPENAFHIDDSKKFYMACMGPTIDQMIIYESFTNFLETVDILGINDVLAKDIRVAREKLARPQIAKDGRIMEWDKEYKEWRINHRHYSHMYGLHPGCEIMKDKSPELFEAARKSVEVRQTNGGVWHGWSRVHLLNLYARLNEGNKAYQTIQFLMKGNTLPNLMHTQPPIFFDGNGAGTAGIAEMLIQSHGPEGVVQFLPALPEVWKMGTFNGLCARGGFEIDLTWEDGRPVKAKVLSKAGRDFIVKTGDKLSVKSGRKNVKIQNKRSGCVSFATQKDEIYELTF